ncbi:hypothetical protein CC78DRAFT_571764 [Lojkania enalia]|uniref:CCHC-type domain-containing protein n=1 Tax=Lojkania enalia TaxID=147567 RepID=A0A9P4JYN9_9PLEO|nr:hypothetical protein CC78DRAFT_571764 [Didymosphaeria enalia]
MAEVELPGLCLGVPIDHRLKPLFSTGLTTPNPSVGFGGHAREIKNYGRYFQKYRKDISNNEIQFAKWLAMPETKGGVVIVLQQPAEHQRYFSDHYQTVKDCNTLSAVDEVCKAITGYGVERVSCFDAFPFHKIPVSKSLEKYEEELDEAYDLFLRMIEQKQPDVVLCCYRSPHSTKYKDFQCIGIGRTRDCQVTVRGRRYTCVNCFHPSYALNYLEDKSELRSLFIIEATQAFRRANGTWRERSWMTKVRENCAAIVQMDFEDKQDQPSWTKHDFQRKRFQSYMKLIMGILNSLKSGVYNDMTNKELYNLFLERRYNVLFHDCLLVLVKIINFEDNGGDRLQDKGFVQLHQREKRDIRDLRRNVVKRCSEFLRSLRVAGAPLQVQKGGKGLLTSDGLKQSLLPLGPFMHQTGFQYNLRLSFLSLAHILNDAHTYRGRDVHDINRNELARAFRLAASYLELALTQHTVRTRGRVSEEDDGIISQLNSLTINSSIRQTGYASGYRSSPTRTASAPSSTCTRCNRTGHSSPSCPETQCYRCRSFGHMSFDCPVYPSTPQRRR